MRSGLPSALNSFPSRIPKVQVQTRSWKKGHLVVDYTVVHLTLKIHHIHCTSLFVFTRKYSDFGLCRVRFFGGVFFHRDFELLLSSESSFLLNVAIYIASLDFRTVKPKPNLHKPSIFNLKNLYSNKMRNSKDDSLPYFFPAQKSSKNQHLFQILPFCFSPVLCDEPPRWSLTPPPSVVPRLPRFSRPNEDANGHLGVGGRDCLVTPGKVSPHQKYIPPI